MANAQIHLVPVEARHKRALGEGKPILQEMLGVQIPEGWPHFPEAFDISDEDAAASVEWPSYFFISPTESSLIGNGGFVGGPNNKGEVEVGYEIAPAFQNRGYATTAVRSLCEIAFLREEVSAVVAHTLANENASNSVLKKIGMTMVAELPNPEVGKVWKWSIPRSEWR